MDPFTSDSNVFCSNEVNLGGLLEGGWSPQKTRLWLEAWTLQPCLSFSTERKGLENGVNYIYNLFLFKIFIFIFRGAWVVQQVKYLILDFGSGHDLTVRGIKHRAYLGLSLPPSAPPLPVLSLSPSQNK